MLAELLEEYKVINTVGEEFGKIKDVYFDLKDWMVSGFQLSPGLFKKDTLLRMDDILQIRDDEKTIIARDDFKGIDLPKEPSLSLFPFDELKRRKIVDRSGEHVGKIYNMEIPYDKLKKLMVWKILIKTGLKERRLRIRPQEISEVLEEIKLHRTLEDYQKRMD
jgi:sporulation protein YlmC with PRC-barrel domain